MFGAQIKNLYQAYNIKLKSDEIPLTNIDKLVNKALRWIQNNPNKLSEDLYLITKNAFDEGIDRSVKLKHNVKNQAFINQLKTNSKVFAAFKSHHQSKAIAALLLDENGEPKTFSKFKKDALTISDQYNKNWLKTEYNTAIRRGKIASKFEKFRQDSDVYPNLKWLPSTSAEPRSSHVRFYGLTLPVNDPFWINQFPGNEWNCKCDIEQTRQKVNSRPEGLEPPADGLEGNPAYTGSLIGNKHPYFKGLSIGEIKDVEALINFDTDREVKEWFDANIDSKKGKSISSSNLKTGSFFTTISRLKKVLNEEPNPFIKTYLTLIFEDITNFQFLKTEKLGDEVLNYYETNYREKKLQVVLIEDNGIEQLILITSN